MAKRLTAKTVALPVGAKGCRGCVLRIEVSCLSADRTGGSPFYPSGRRWPEGPDEGAPGANPTFLIPTARSLPYFPSRSFTRRPNASLRNGFVITCMPWSRWPWFSTAFSA